MASLRELYLHAANPERTRFGAEEEADTMLPKPPSFAEEVQRRSAPVASPRAQPPPREKSREPRHRDRSRSRSRSSMSSRGSRGSRGSRRSRSRGRSRSRDRYDRYDRYDQYDRRSHRSRRSSHTEHFDDIESTAHMGKAFRKSEEEMEAEKMSMFAELKRICPDSSMWTNPKIGMNSSYEVISMELDIQKRNIDEDQKVFIARLLLGAACKGVEWGSGLLYRTVNGKFLQLEGWAASIMADTAQFDPILRRCYRKMFPQGMGNSDPFVDLAIALAISAVTYGLLARGMNSNVHAGATSTSVPSNANSFMDRNAPTPAQNRVQAAQARTNPPKPGGPGGGGGGGGFLDSLMGMFGGGGGGNPMSQIFGMMQNGGLQNFMQGVQNHGKEPPTDPFEATSAPTDHIPDPVQELHRDAQNVRPPPMLPTRRDPYSQPVSRKQAPPNHSNHSNHPNRSNRRPPTPPFDERTGEFEHKRARLARRHGHPHRRPDHSSIPSPVFGEPSTENTMDVMDPPDEEDFQGDDTASIYENSSAATMECSSSDGEVGEID
jgi:hypothetical protein